MNLGTVVWPEILEFRAVMVANSPVVFLAVLVFAG
jgi:hypothetical protein